MADEISVIVKLSAAKGGAYLGTEQYSVALDMTGTHMGDATQTIGTGSDEALTLPADLTGNHYLYVKSLEAEGGNYVEFSNATGGSFTGGIFARLQGGAAMLVPRTGTTYAKANTASVNIQWKACQF